MPELIFKVGDAEIMKRSATLVDVKNFLKENNGQIAGREVKTIRAELTPDLKIIRVEFETEA